MGILGGITRPVGDMAQKAAKAGKIKSVKVKVKMQDEVKKPSAK